MFPLDIILQKDYIKTYIYEKTGEMGEWLKPAVC